MAFKISSKSPFMYKILCPACRSSHTMKNGKRKGVQLYVCRECGYQFRNTRDVLDEQIWKAYSQNKQTITELADHFHVSESTIKRKLRYVEKKWVQPPLSGSGFVNIDATYWGRNTGIIVALDYASGKPIYLKSINHEHLADYTDAVESIESRGYVIKGIVLDGIRSLFDEWKEKYKLQMCQFHLKQLVRRYLTLNPRLLAARDLKALVDGIVTYDEADFLAQYQAWKDKWKDTINKRSLSSITGKQHYTHKKLRTVMNSVDFYLPYLFTYQHEDCSGMPNTNNKIEGTFTDLKKNLNNHSGMSASSRDRFINGFFLALLDTPSINEKQE